MPVQIKTQFHTRVKYTSADSWHIKVIGPLRILQAVSADGVYRDIAITHTFDESDAVQEYLEAAHIASGDEKVLVSARDAVMAVRREHRGK